MISVRSFAAAKASAPLAPFNFNRREVGPHDVLIDIRYCGVCHSDLHQVRDEWGGSIFPMVPGHEIVGTITRIGSSVKKFSVGDTAGIGCFVDSCRTCESCREGLEQYCEGRLSGTYNSLEQDGKTPTYGGYSTQIVVDEAYTLKISPALDLKRVAPLLCAGITTYSPLRYWKIGNGHRVGVLGLGGLGHMAVKFAVALGADVTVLSTSKSKESDAHQLGAHHFALTTDAASVKSLRNRFDFIIDTVSAPHDMNQFIAMLRRDGTIIVVGAPPDASPVQHFSLIGKRKKIAGSMIGGIRETQEMLDYCAQHNILSDIELISIKDVDHAYERMLKADVKYRFVIDCATI